MYIIVISMTRVPSRVARSQHREQVHACAWLPGGTRFVCGGADKSITTYGIGGEEVARWKKTYRVQAGTEARASTSTSTSTRPVCHAPHARSWAGYGPLAS